jgi:hypothetical protein
MVLFALVLNLLLYLLERNLTDSRTGHRTRKTAVVSYADDVTIFVRTPEDIQLNTTLTLRGPQGWSG